DHAATLGSAERPAALATVIEEVAALPHARALASDELLRVDAASRLAITLPHAVGGEVTRMIGDYARLYARLYPPRSFLAPYVRRFLAHHPGDADVPALDLYHGVFDDDALERAAAFPMPAAGEPEARATFARVRAHFVEQARSAGGRAVQLADDTL